MAVTYIYFFLADVGEIFDSDLVTDTTEPTMDRPYERDELGKKT